MNKRFSLISACLSLLRCCWPACGAGASSAGSNVISRFMMWGAPEELDRLAGGGG